MGVQSTVMRTAVTQYSLPVEKTERICFPAHLAALAHAPIQRFSRLLSTLPQLPRNLTSHRRVCGKF